MLAVHVAASGGPVSISQDEQIYTLSNGVLIARIDKRSGGLRSLNYNGVETLSDGAYWSHSAASRQMTDRITIDPKTNDGERGEVSIKGFSNGYPMGSGPGGSAVVDIEIRYCLGRDDGGIYTYTIWEHKPAYPSTNVGEARFCASSTIPSSIG